ncbi:unnamed protein product [Allacma fusca]|uniref:glutathione transferase n=1 Tax=Allacma fusca TaxID=39272 RepID=A0A8J2PNH0_9HEXA|nr:unnamed protein product [Allacma fusca]
MPDVVPVEATAGEDDIQEVKEGEPEGKAKVHDAKVKRSSSFKNWFKNLVPRQPSRSKEYDIQKAAGKLQEKSDESKEPDAEATSANEQEDVEKSKETKLDPEMPCAQDATHYNMDHPYRGKALILNFEEFDTKLKLKFLRGSSKDKVNLTSCLEKLQFEVESYDDLTVRDFCKVLDKVQQDGHEKRDCLVVAIMTHGNVDAVKLKDGTIMPSNLIWEQFSSSKCPSLAGKPKIFIFQAGKASSTEGSKSPEHNGKDKGDETDARPFSHVVPNDADNFVVFSSPLGQRSLKSPKHGSWLIQAICEVLEKHAYDEGEDLDSLFLTVKRKVSSNTSKHSDPDLNESAQVPIVSSSLMRKVVFRPKKESSENSFGQTDAQSPNDAEISEDITSSVADSENLLPVEAETINGNASHVTNVEVPAATNNDVPASSSGELPTSTNQEVTAAGSNEICVSTNGDLPVATGEVTAAEINKTFVVTNGKLLADANGGVSSAKNDEFPELASPESPVANNEAPTGAIVESPALSNEEDHSKTNGGTPVSIKTYSSVVSTPEVRADANSSTNSTPKDGISGVKNTEDSEVANLEASSTTEYFSPCNFGKEDFAALCTEEYCSLNFRNGFLKSTFITIHSDLVANVSPGSVNFFLQGDYESVLSYIITCPASSVSFEDQSHHCQEHLKIFFHSKFFQLSQRYTMASEKDTTKYVLYYYNGRGLAEPIRLLLSYGGASFEDKRAPLTSFVPLTPLPAEWKERALFSQVPILEFEGKQITQSLAITRYLARRYNLVGKDDFEAAKCDELADGVREYFMMWVSSYREQDAAKKQAIFDEASAAGNQRFLPKFRSVLEANGGKNLVGDGLTWADLYVAYFLDNIKKITNVEILKDYPDLQEYANNILSTPGFKKWVDQRPETQV